MIPTAITLTVLAACGYINWRGNRQLSGLWDGPDALVMAFLWAVAIIVSLVSWLIWSLFR